MAVVLGIKEMRRNIDFMNRELQAIADPAALAAGEPIAKAWRSLVPVLDANYQRSIKVANTGKGVAVGTSWLPDLPRNEQPVLYSKRLEFGDSEIAAQPSARPALAQSRQEAIDAAGVEISSVVKGRAKRTRRQTSP